MIDLLNRSLDKVYLYCKDQNWAGYDPFDGLNSHIFQKLPFFNEKKIFRLIFLQINKKSPFNLRPLLMVPKDKNPKGIGLFLQATLNLHRRIQKPDYLETIRTFIGWLNDNAAPGYSGKCWGYNFDWQNRTFFLPEGTPTVVNTSFIGRAFINAYEALGETELLEIARSSCGFILKDLNQIRKNGSLGFSYSPLDHYFINNATALASSLLGMVYSKTRETELAEAAKQSALFVIAHQQNNGSWNYGEDQIGLKVGIDNFHTGFILESLKIYSETTGDEDYIEKIKKGLQFYQDNFFLKNGAPKYFYNKIYPLDIHSAAQSIITLVQLKKYGSDMRLCQKIINWMVANMEDEEGYFYYQKNRFFTIKIPYIRWAQAWAFLALTEYLNQNAD
jgi:hypothetical protein